MIDLISREAALNCFHAWVDKYGDVYTPDEMPEYQAIEALPSVQPERKRGRWIPVTNGRGGHECSLCHTYAPSFQTGDEWLTDYCPNCGADMRGKQDDSISN